jgi:hypothetical protein
MPDSRLAPIDPLCDLRNRKSLTDEFDKLLPCQTSAWRVPLDIGRP